MERLAMEARIECDMTGLVERRVAERRMGERRQGERRQASLNYKFLLLGIACRRSGQDRRVCERRRGDRRASNSC
ncbi:MAG: hypothetical protein WHX93_09555 [bacterium]